MTKQNTITTCPVCGASIPEEAPGGLCPNCVLKGAETVASSSNPGAGRAAPPSVEEIGPHFPDLEIIELLGAGGMGAVYKARQPQLDRTVALKILSHDLAGDPAFVERFNREARLLARLSHPNIVAVFDFGTAGSHCYLLMEHVDGVNLRQAMRTGGFTPTEALALVQEICSALKYAHEEGVLHRDIKPENILIDAKGRVKIADFGIAKLIGEGDPSQVTLTLQGSILGSPHYMAPEQIETPGDVDQRADIYSLGVVLYEMLTGELPIGRFALPSQKTAMDARIDEIVLRTLEKEREARFQTAEEVRTSVDALAQNPPAQPEAPAPQATGERPAAKFSLAAALLTGASLILGALFFWMFFTLAPVSRAVAAQPSATEMAEGISSRLPMMVLSILHVILGAGTALVGFILGAKALGDVRESGGRKRGLGSATFGALAWPVVFLFSLAFLIGSLGGGLDGSNGDLWWIPIPVILVAALVAVFLLVRGVVRWAGGVDDGQDERRHPGFGGALIVALLTVILVPSLAAGMAAAFSNKEGDRGRSALQRQDVATSSGPPQVRWRTGEPELTLPLVLRPAQKASLRVFFREADGDTRSVNLGEASYRPEAPDKHSVVTVGTELHDTLHRMVVTKSGVDSRLVRSLEDLRGWEFNEALPEELTFDSPGRHEFQLATLRGNTQDTPAEVLILEVVVAESQAEDAPRESRNP